MQEVELMNGLRWTKSYGYEEVDDEPANYRTVTGNNVGKDDSSLNCVLAASSLPYFGATITSQAEVTSAELHQRLIVAWHAH